MDVQTEKVQSSGLVLQNDDHSLNDTQVKTKRDAIVQACKNGNLKQLAQLASSAGGLLDDEVRQSACMTASQPVETGTCY